MTIPLLNQAAAAVRIGISLRSFQRACASDDPPNAVRLGDAVRDVRYHPDDLDAWVERRRRAAAATRTVVARNGSSLVTCPHCGDVTEHEMLLEEFTCGQCDKPFAPRVATEVAS